MGLIDTFEALLADGRDDALLRFSLGNAYLQQGDYRQAAAHLRAAVAHEPGYSAAWKLLGKALEAQGEPHAAIEAYAQGIAVAEAKGDKQVAKEMAVFKRRLEKQRDTQHGE